MSSRCDSRTATRSTTACTRSSHEASSSTLRSKVHILEAVVDHEQVQLFRDEGAAKRLWYELSAVPASSASPRFPASRSSSLLALTARCSGRNGRNEGSGWLTVAGAQAPRVGREVGPLRLGGDRRPLFGGQVVLEQRERETEPVAAGAITP